MSASIKKDGTNHSKSFINITNERVFPSDQAAWDWPKNVTDEEVTAVLKAFASILLKAFIAAILTSRDESTKISDNDWQNQLKNMLEKIDQDTINDIFAIHGLMNDISNHNYGNAAIKICEYLSDRDYCPSRIPTSSSDPV